MKILGLTLLLALTVLRLWLAGVSEVTPLDAYYWMCAQRLDWAFFDGPGGTAWLVHLGTLACGDSPLGLRLAFPFFAMLATVGVFLLGRSLFGVAAGFWAATAINALPPFNAAAVHAGPDLPALALTLLAGWTALRALEKRPSSWLLSGGLLALAVQFQIASLLLLVGIAAVCVVSSRHRTEWRLPGLYLAIALACAGLGPWLLWNRAHEWPALAVGTLQTVLTPEWNQLGSALRANASLLPLTAWAALAFTVWTLARSARIHARPRLALCLTAPFLLLWGYFVLNGSIAELPLLMASAILLSASAHIFLDSSRFRQFGAALLALTAALSLWPNPQNTWTRSSHGLAWSEIAASVDALLARAQPSQPKPLFVIAQDADAAAALNYYLAHTAHPEVFLRESQDISNQFGLWPRYDDFVQTSKPADDFFKLEGNTTNPNLGRAALYLTEERADDLPQTITGAFGRVILFATLELVHDRKLRVYLCEDYQTMPL